LELDSLIDTTGDYFESLLAAAARANAAARSAGQFPKNDMATDRPHCDGVRDDGS